MLGAVFVAGIASACDVGPACHYGADYDQLTEFLLARVSNPSGNCFADPCLSRKVQVLLSHPPVGCGDDVNAKWADLVRECGSNNGVCCPTCTSQTTAHCDDSYTASDTVVATAYVVVVALLLLIKAP